MARKDIKHHPLAEIFPPMSPEEMKELTASIAKHGLRRKITLFEGKILDGRSRYQGCAESGEDPKYEQYKGTDPVGFVMTENLHRRHLSTAQRAMVAAKLATTKWGGNSRLKEPTLITNELASEIAKVSKESVQLARKIDEASPETAKKVASGEMSLNAAEKAVNEEQAKKAKKDPEVRDKVGRLIPEELHAIWERRDEPLRYMKAVASIENELLEFQKAEDPIFSTLNYSDVVSRLQYLHMIFNSSQLYALCPSCQGRCRAKCGHCKGRGFLSRFAWNNVPDKELILRMSK